tara:strand:+ start:1575 stop:1877 length:303 start_codon:yes stop_codon:yes gene_type:complete
MSKEFKNKIFNTLIKNETTDIYRIVKIVMESVEKLKINGKTKMDIALDLISEFINIMPDNDLKTVLMGSLRVGLFKSMIELICAASKNKMKINNMKSFCC